MKKLLSLMLCALMALTLAGCGGSGSAGKTFTFASELDIKNLDSSDADDGMSFDALHACIDGLMGLDKDGNIVGAIAKDHTVSDDGLVHTFKLRNAKWSNGDPVTAKDFVYAWHRIVKNNGNYAYMLGTDGAAITGVDEIMEKIANKEKVADSDYDAMGVKAVDDKTLEVTTTRKIDYFEELMTFPCYYPINQKFCEKAGDQYGKSAKNILSNGAFVMDSWSPGSKATFKKNDKYWNKKAVKLDTLVMNLVQEPKVGATNFKSGKNDFTTINSELVDKYKKDKAYTTFGEGYLFYLSLNFKTKELQNLNVRTALSYAINRDDFADNVLKDGSKGATGYVPSGLSTSPDGKDFREEAGTLVSYDAAKAQEYLDKGLQELGVSKIKLRLTYGTDESPMDQMATYLQNAFSKLNGLEIEMVATTKQDRIYNKQKNGDFDICCTRWGPDYADPTTYLNLLLDGNANNYGKYSNAAYEEKMNEVTDASDAKDRWQKMIEAEKIAMDDYAFIPVFEKGAAALKNPKVKNLVHKAVGVPYTFNYVDIK